MKILLLSHYFDPDTHVGAVRWRRLCKWLKENGCEIYVVSVLNERNSLSEYSEKVIRVSPHVNLYVRLINWLCGVKDGNLVNSNNNFSGGKKTQGYWKGLELVSHVVGRVLRFPDRYWWVYKQMVKEAIEITNRVDIDILIATHPYPGCLKAASVLSRKTGIPWIADMRDGWSSYYNSVYVNNRVYNWTIKKIEKNVIASADRIVAVNRKLADTISSETRKVEIITNSYDNQLLRISRVAKRKKEEGVSFAFAGTILVNHNWPLFFDLLKRLIGFLGCDTVKVQYYGRSIKTLEELADREAINHDVFVNNGYLNNIELRTELGKSDFLVILGFNGKLGDTVTTAKVFDYIETGRPIIVFGSLTSELGQLVKETGIGIVIQNCQDSEIAANLLYLDKNSILDKLGVVVNYQQLVKYSTEQTGSEYYSLINEILKKRSRNT